MRNAEQHLDNETLRRGTVMVIGSRRFLLDQDTGVVALLGQGLSRWLELDTLAGQAIFQESMIAERAAQKAIEDALDDENANTELDNQPIASADPQLEVLLDRAMVSIFSLAAIEKANAQIKYQEEDRKKRLQVTLNAAAEGFGRRRSPFCNAEQINALADRLRAQFPNFHEAIEALEASFALAIDDPDYVIPAVLVHGEPGIGKTTFAMALADELKVSFEMVSGGSMQGSFDISGTSSHWTNAAPGKVIRALAEGKSASPVFLIDEIDKVSGDDRFSPIPTLLDLLEHRTAQRFRDEAIQLSFDASKIVFILTANDLTAVSSALQSRVQVIKIQPPTAEQRFDIALSLIEHYVEVDVPKSEVERIAGVPGDLRKLQQIIRKAAGLARSRGNWQIFYDVIKRDLKPTKSRQIGFVG